MVMIRFTLLLENGKPDEKIYRDYISPKLTLFELKEKLSKLLKLSPGKPYYY